MLASKQCLAPAIGKILRGLSVGADLLMPTFDRRGFRMNNRSRSPTILDVAKKGGVSVMTASRVINAIPHCVQPREKKVLAAIAELGYSQNEAARLLKGMRGKTIGLIVPDLSDAFFAMCAYTAQQIACSHGYMMFVASSDRDSNLENKAAELMAARKIAGLLVVTSSHGETGMKLLQQTGLVIVAFDRPIEGTETDAVEAENRQRGRRSGFALA
jgi:LacI family transcriptional regulator